MDIAEIIVYAVLQSFMQAALPYALPVLAWFFFHRVVMKKAGETRRIDELIVGRGRCSGFEVTGGFRTPADGVHWLFHRGGFVPTLAVRSTQRNYSGRGDDYVGYTLYAFSKLKIDELIDGTDAAPGKVVVHVYESLSP